MSVDDRSLRKGTRDTGGRNRRREDQMIELEERRANQVPIDNTKGTSPEITDLQGALDRYGPNAASRAKQAFLFQP